MAELVNRRTGERVQVDDDRLGELIQSGAADDLVVPEDQAIRVVDEETGRVGTTRAADLQTALSGGFRLASAGEIDEDRRQREFGEGVGNAVRAAGESAFNNLLVGAGDAVLTGFGADPEGIQERRARNEVSSVVGAGVGLLAPALVSGGGSLAAQAGRAGLAARSLGTARSVVSASPAALTLRAGRAAERAIARGLGDGLLAKTAGATVSGAGEGALFGMGSAMSNVALNAEEALGDHETVGEYVFASAGEGAVFGSGAASVLTLGPGALRQAASRVTQATRGAMGRAFSQESVEELLDGFAFSASRGRKKFAEDAERFISAEADEFVQGGGARQAGRYYRQEIDFQPGDTVQSLGAKMEARRAVHAERARDALREADEVSAAVSVDDVMARVEARVLREMSGRGAGTTSKRVAASVRKEVQEMLGVRELREARAKRNALLAERTARGESRLRKLESELESATKKAAELDDAARRAGEKSRELTARQLGPDERVSGATRGARAERRAAMLDRTRSVVEAKAAARTSREAADKAQEQVDALIDKRDKLTGAADNLPREIESLNRKIERLENVTLSDLRRRRIAFEQSVQLNKRANTTKASTLLSARNAIEAEIEDGARAAGVFDTYKDAKQRMSAFSIGAESAKDTLNRDQVNRFFSLSDMQSLQIGTGVGVAAALAQGEGPSIESLGLGLIAGALNKAARTKGAQTLVALSNRIQGLRKLDKGAQGVSSSLESAVKGIVSRIREGAARTRGAAALAAGGEATREQKYAAYRERRDALAKLQANPERLAAVVRELSEDGAPNVASATARTASRAVRFLESVAPRERQGSMVRGDLDDTHRVSDAEVNKFLRYARAVEDPLSVLRDAENGDVTREGVDALRAVYPRLYERVVDQVVEGLAELDKPPPMSSLVQMSVLLGTPLHYSMRPEFIRTHQQMFAAQRQQQAQAVPPSRRSAPDSADALATPTQALEAAQ